MKHASGQSRAVPQLLKRQDPNTKPSYSLVNRAVLLVHDSQTLVQLW